MEIWIILYFVMGPVFAWFLYHWIEAYNVKHDINSKYTSLDLRRKRDFTEESMWYGFGLICCLAGLWPIGLPMAIIGKMFDHRGFELKIIPKRGPMKWLVEELVNPKGNV